MTSTVKKWNEEKGYGFIENPEHDGRDIFVHHTNIQGPRGRKNLAPGQTVDFTVEENEKGLNALNVARR